MTSNKVFNRWGEVIGDGIVAAAMTDRLPTTPKRATRRRVGVGAGAVTRAGPGEPASGVPGQLDRTTALRQVAV